MNHHMHSESGSSHDTNETLGTVEPKEPKNQKTAFTFDEEAYLINFVKEHPVLYMVNHIDFRKNTLKNSLWIQCAKELGKKRE